MTIQTPPNRKGKVKLEENNELRCLGASRLWVSSRLSPFQHRDHKTANSLLHCLTQLVCTSSPSASHISRKVIMTIDQPHCPKTLLYLWVHIHFNIKNGHNNDRIKQPIYWCAALNSLPQALLLIFRTTASTSV